jgi:hypothetical protein
MTKVFNNSSLSIEKGIAGVNLAPGYDNTIQEVIVIPPLLEILALPRYLQEKECGVYPGGIGTYLKDGVCFIYPPYDTTQVSKGAETLTILNIPPDLYPAAESTWVKYENSYFVLSTANAMIIDTTDLEQGSLGSGIQYINADAILRSGYKVSQGNVEILENKNLVTSFISNRRDKFNFATPNEKLITANHMNANSALAKRNGAMGRFVWENSKIGVIKPGMGVRLLTLKGSKVAEYHGVIQRAVHSIASLTKNVGDKFFTTTSKIDLFMTPKPVNEYDLE